MVDCFLHQGRFFFNIVLHTLSDVCHIYKVERKGSWGLSYRAAPNVPA